MNMPLVLLNRRRRGFTAFSPSTLFSTTAIGIWLDPSDLSTMFSDRAGTTAVTTPGTVVGLRLDKSKGLVLGSELVTNGTFDANITGWTPARGDAVWSAGKIRTTNNIAISSAVASSPIATVAGKTYRFSVSVGDVNLLTFGRVRVGTDVGLLGTELYGTAFAVQNTTVTGVFVAQGTTSYITVGNFAGGTSSDAWAEFDNISVRELAGNHAVAPTDAARPIYGVEPKGGRRNLLTYSEQMDNAVWTKPAAGTGVAAVVTPNFGADPDGGLTACRVQLNKGAGTTSGDYSGFQQVFSSSAPATASVYVKTNDGTTKYLAFKANSANTGVLVDGTWRRLTVSETTTGFLQIILRGTYGTSDTADLLIWHPQLELGSTATNYQRVTTAYDVTESGVATCHYVQYDGSDDSMSTAAIDFTATDKMSVFAGVRKLSDTTSAFVLEHSADSIANSGTFALQAPAGAAPTYGFRSRGNSLPALTITPSTFSSPISSVLTGLGSIVPAMQDIRVNGTLSATSTQTQGSGNYGNYPLFLGRRNNASNPFNGKDYGIIVVGKAASAGEITDTETWLAAKTSGVTL